MARVAQGHPLKQEVRTVERALSLLVAFHDGDGPLTLTALAARAALHKSTALRLFASLLARGFLRRLPDGRYHLGPECFRLAHLYQRSFRLAELVVPALQRLSEATGETAAFYIRDGNTRVCLHRVESSRTVRATASEGARFPLDRGASGKLFLAFEDPPRAKFAALRRTMYAVSIGERDPETSAIACPVFGVTGALAGALNVSGPRVRMTPAVFDRIMPLLVTMAAELTKNLGGNPSRLLARLQATQGSGPRGAAKPARRAPKA